MICRVVFAFLAVGIVAAQQEYVLYTNGRGNNEMCGRYHLCTSDAKCLMRKIDDTNYKMCVCQDKLVGNGKLFCKNPLDKTLYIQSDPHVKNFFNEFASLPTPCRYRLAHLVMVPTPGSITRVELFGENLLFRDGEYFLNKLTLTTSLDLGGGVGMMKQSFEFYGDVSDDGLNYTLVARSLENDNITVPEGADVFNLKGGAFDGYTMNVDKDDTNNLLRVTIPNLGITLMFRPPSTNERLDNAILPMVPGAVFIVDHKKWDLVQVDESDFEISSWPTGPSLSDMATQLKTSKPLLVQYLMLNNTMSNPVYNDDDVCRETGRIFRDECPLESTRLRMLKICSPLYTDKNFLRIITGNKTVERYTSLIKDFFQRCELSFCRLNYAECLRVKADILMELGDEAPVSVDLDCDLLKPPMKATRVELSFSEQEPKPAAGC